MELPGKSEKLKKGFMDVVRVNMQAVGVTDKFTEERWRGKTVTRCGDPYNSDSQNKQRSFISFQCSILELIFRS